MCVSTCWCMHAGMYSSILGACECVSVCFFFFFFSFFFVGLGTYFCYKFVIQWPVCIYVIIRLKMLKSYRETHMILITGPAVRTEPYRWWGKNKTKPIKAKHTSSLLTSSPSTHSSPLKNVEAVMMFCPASSCFHQKNKASLLQTFTPIQPQF